MNNSVFLILSSGRSGTSWINSTLKNFYSSEICAVQTQGQGIGFHPRVTLNAFKDEEVIRRMENEVEITRYLSYVKEQIKTKSFFETGWVLYTSIPLLIKHFPGKVKIVYLTRHPLNVAASWTNRGIYSKERANDYLHEEAFLTPFDTGVIHTEYSSKWSTMNSFEKILFNWAEIQQYAQKIRNRYKHIPFYEIKFEDLVSKSDKRKKLLSFLNLKHTTEFDKNIEKNVDKNTQVMKLKWPVRDQWKSFENVPHVVDVAKKLGYNVDKESFSKQVDLYNVNIKELFFEYTFKTLKYIANKNSFLKKAIKKVLTIALPDSAYYKILGHGKNCSKN